MVILAACLSGGALDRARAARRRRRAHRLRRGGEGAADLLPAVLRVEAVVAGVRGGARDRRRRVARARPRLRAGALRRVRRVIGSRSRRAAGRSARATRASTPWSTGSIPTTPIVWARHAQAPHRLERSGGGGHRVRAARGRGRALRARGRGAADAAREPGRHHRARDRALRRRALRAARLEALLRLPAARAVRPLARGVRRRLRAARRARGGGSRGCSGSPTCSTTLTVRGVVGKTLAQTLETMSAVTLGAFVVLAALLYCARRRQRASVGDAAAGRGVLSDARRRQAHPDRPPRRDRRRRARAAAGEPRARRLSRTPISRGRSSRAPRRSSRRIPRSTTASSSSAAAGRARSSPFLRRVRAERFDLVLDLQRHAKSGLVSVASRRARAHRLPSPQRQGAQLALEHAHHRAGRSARLEARAVSALRATSSSCPATAPRFDVTLTAPRRPRASPRCWRRSAAASPRSSSARPGRAELWFADRLRRRVDALDARGLDAVLVGGDDVRAHRRGDGAHAPAARRSISPRARRSARATAFSRVPGRDRPGLGTDAPRRRRRNARSSRSGARPRPRARRRSARRISSLVGRVPCAPCYLRRCPDRPPVHAGHHTGARPGAGDERVLAGRRDDDDRRLTRDERRQRLGRWRVWSGSRTVHAGARAWRRQRSKRCRAAATRCTARSMPIRTAGRDREETSTSRSIVATAAGRRSKTGFGPRRR